MHPASFTYHTPTSLDEALSLMSEHSDAKLLAGGHSLMPTLKLRLATPAHLIDMRKLRGDLQYIRDEGDYIAIGALSTYYQVESNDIVRNKIPLLAQLINNVGDLQVRNCGTLGGAIAHADPAGDPPAAILALEAEMVIRGAEGERTISASEFFFGFFETAVGEGEILTEIRMPVQKGGSSYQKMRHPASGYAVVGVAAVIGKEGENIGKCRVAITGVSDGAYRAEEVENALSGQAFSADAANQAAEHATDGIDPLEDPFANAPYRRQLAKALTKQALMEAWENA